ILWVDSELLEQNEPECYLKDADAIIVPGGFGKRGTLGKIKAITYAREHQIPFLGICFGMQMAVIETMRNVAGVDNADTTEFNADCTPVVGLMHEWQKDGKTEQRSEDGDLGGTMRLGAYPCVLKEGSKVRQIYGTDHISERHRHRYEVNTNYEDVLEKSGMRIVGKSPDGKLPEIVERTNHPWFIGVQFHPELKSKPFAAHPLFVDLIKTALKLRCENSEK
ncbi:MAG: gamma-glutamyl-gamma-aminobutyrate hydrolase family protein, partial [Alphaproteobacteria bacterium]|nr:gamma-glutamyl-gamma-aminobutyrate hydrolase family protein [Alphaproteobacteria bacterium]